MGIYNAGRTKIELEAKINELLDTIISNNNVLGTRAAWLFVGTLGCYSVSELWLQLIAIVIIFLFYAIHVDGKRNTEKSYEDSKRYITNCIKHGADEITDQEKEVMLLDLNQKMHTHLSFFSSKSSNIQFMLSVIFWTITLVNILMKLDLENKMN